MLFSLGIGGVETIGQLDIYGLRVDLGLGVKLGRLRGSMGFGYLFI
jgi:hypothetical protein